MEKHKTQKEVDAEDLSKEEAALAEWLSPDEARMEGLLPPLGDQAVRKLVLCDRVEDGWRWSTGPEGSTE